MEDGSKGKELVAKVDPHVGTSPGRKDYYTYHFECEGLKSRGTCYDLARVLYAAGHKGDVKVIGPSGKHRYSFNIEAIKDNQIYESNAGFRIREYVPYNRDTDK